MPDGSNGHICTFKVDASNIDHMGRVNNTVYLRWIQSAVTSFWRQSAPGDVVHSVAWIALKREISYRRPAFARSVWCRVDVTSLRPVRLARSVRNLFLSGSEATA